MQARLLGCAEWHDARLKFLVVLMLLVGVRFRMGPPL